MNIRPYLMLHTHPKITKALNSCKKNASTFVKNAFRFVSHLCLAQQNTENAARRVPKPGMIMFKRQHTTASGMGMVGMARRKKPFVFCLSGFWLLLSRDMAAVCSVLGYL
jgi:hypothetical protein